MSTLSKSYVRSAEAALQDSINASNAAMGDLFAQHAQVFATLALVEEQRTANLIAALDGESLVSPHQVGTPENTAWWRGLGQIMTDRLDLS